MDNKSIAAPERAAQRGVKMGFEQNAYSSASTRWVSPAIPVGTDDFSIEFYGNTLGAKETRMNTISNLEQPVAYREGTFMVYTGFPEHNGLGWVLFEGTAAGDGVLMSCFDADLSRKFHLVVTRSGATVKVYVDGELKAEKEQSSVRNFPVFRLGLANSSDIALCRMYNHALTPEQVGTLWNDGAPADYVLPGGMKGCTPVAVEGPNACSWRGEAAQPGVKSIGVSRLLTPGQRYRVNYTISDYVKGCPRIFVGRGPVGLPGRNGTGEVIVECGEAMRELVIYGTYIGRIGSYTVTVDGIEPLGCVAEYLPQNIVPVEEDPVTVVDKDPSFTWTGTDGPYSHVIGLSRKLTIGGAYKITVTLSDYQAGDPFLLVDDASSHRIPHQDGTYEVYVKKTTDYPHLVIYGGAPASDRRLTLTIDSIEPAGNIGRVWYDSAGQVPAPDGGMPPLGESPGGYDMAADGLPEILFENKKKQTSWKTRI